MVKGDNVSIDRLRLHTVHIMEEIVSKTRHQQTIGERYHHK